MSPNNADRMANSADRDQTAPLANSVDPDGAVRSGSALFASVDTDQTAPLRVV